MVWRGGRTPVRFATLTVTLLYVLTVLPPVLLRPAAAQVFDPYIVGMMAGPVSDGPSILLLKKRGEKFLRVDTLIVACTAGAASGVVAHGLPVAVAVANGLAGLPGLAVVTGTALFGCAVGAGAGAAAMATQWLLNRWHARL